MRDINVLPTWLYQLFNANGEAIYIGVTCDLPWRLAEHSEKAWWTHVDAVSAECFPDREQALAFEAMEIRYARPLWNREVPPEPVIRPEWCNICGYLGMVEGTPSEVIEDFRRGLVELSNPADRMLCPFCLRVPV